MRRLPRVARRAWAARWLLLQVYLLLGITWLAIKCVPFQRLVHYLGPPMTETPWATPAEQQRTAQRIAWAVRCVSPYTPWPSNCFPQALTAKLLLRWQGIPSTLYLGAAFKPNANALEGHAWLRCGSLYVIGGNGHKHFGAIASFGEAV